MDGTANLLIVATIFLFIIAPITLRIVRQSEKGLIERFGKYARTADSGLTVVIPFFEKLRKIDMREQVIDVPPQEVITKDNVLVTVDAVIYYLITDPFKTMYNVNNFIFAAVKLAQTNLRNIVGDMELDHVLSSREHINTQLREVLDEATDKWGARINRVEIQKIEPPAEIVEAMSKQMKAEREKRANILEAEGFRQAAILKAEGAKQGAILEAEGRSEAIKKVSDAEKYQIEIVYNAIHAGNPTNDLIAIKYLETLGKIANGTANKVFIPYEANGIAASLAGMAELFKKGFSKTAA